MTDETRARFLTAIAAQLPVERIVEVHLFAAIRQGGMESGVAVVAVERPVADVADRARRRRRGSCEAGQSTTLTWMSNRNGRSTPCDDRTRPSPPCRAPRRYTVFSARYRHTLKGPDRGKWETSVTEEADAPLLTVDAVVRGVQRRSGDVDEIVRLTGDELRAAVPATAAP